MQESRAVLKLIEEADEAQKYTERVIFDNPKGGR